MTHNYKSLHCQASNCNAGGFTLIELMIVIAIIAIILSLALPVFTNYGIRAKIGESLSVGNSAVTAVSATCVEDRKIPSLTNSKAGYAFVAGSDDTSYIADIQASGPCTDPVITITTKNTGHSPDPILVLTGEYAGGSGHIRWTCSSSNAPNRLLPDTCRS
jgi:type IV pilus assembly protein PilA